MVGLGLNLAIESLMRKAWFNRPLGGLLRALSTILSFADGEDKRKFRQCQYLGLVGGYFTTLR